MGKKTKTKNNKEKLWFIVYYFINDLIKQYKTTEQRKGEK